MRYRGQKSVTTVLRQVIKPKVVYIGSIKKNILTVHSIIPDQKREANKSKEERCIDELVIEHAQETGEEEYTVCFRVIDTGIGVSKDKANEIFLPFTQEDIAHTRVYGGTGECGLLTRTRDGRLKKNL